MFVIYITHTPRGKTIAADKSIISVGFIIAQNIHWKELEIIGVHPISDSALKLAYSVNSQRLPFPILSSKTNELATMNMLPICSSGFSTLR